MNLEAIDLVFPREYLRAALMVSLLSVWLLVGLFYYLNRYTRRDYFTVWTAAWLFYALWLTLSLQAQNAKPDSLVFMIKQCCVAVSAAFLLWGSLRFLNLYVRQTLFGMFILFLIVWTFVSPQVLSNPLQIQVPVFILLGLSSVFAAVCFYRLRRKMPFVGAGMLSLGFMLWGLYLASYPFSQEYENLYSAGFFVAAVLQLFIAVSMIVLVLEEVRYNAEQVRAEVAAIRSEKDALEVKVLTTEEECRNLYDRVRLTEGTQKAYDELRRTQQVVVQQERLRALGQMASGVAHDIYNALSPVTAYSELLLSTQPNLSETSEEYLQSIKTAGDDIANIVARMREFYRRRSETEPLVQVNINRVIEEVIELTRPRWRDLPQRDGASIQIQRELDPKPPILWSEPTELREGLINLVFNAVDALPQGGTITLATHVIDLPASDRPGAAKQNLQIEVRDNGVGMDEKTRQRCLEPFFSTKALRGGSGLGLAMVYGMMQRHEGSVEIESAPGRGTTVRLTFPVREHVPQTASNIAPSVKQARSLRILCIDDEPKLQRLLRNCLSNFNHQVSVAPTGAYGLEMFRAALAKKQSYDVVITDLGMPDVDGHEVARNIKKVSRTTPVVMMTGWETMMKEDGEITPDVDALIGKPPKIKELNDLLLRLTTPTTPSAQAT